MTAGEEEEVDEQGGDGDRESQEQGSPYEGAEDGRRQRRQDDREEDDDHWADDPAQHDGGDCRRGRQRRLGERIQPMKRGWPRSPEEVRDGGRGLVGLCGFGWLSVGQATASASPASRSRSPCGNRALVRRAMAFRIR